MRVTGILDEAPNTQRCPEVSLLCLFQAPSPRGSKPEPCCRDDGSSLSAGDDPNSLVSTALSMTVLTGGTDFSSSFLSPLGLLCFPGTGAGMGRF